jgi:glycosyltransferase involved in cell wall biosynthesis
LTSTATAEITRSIFTGITESGDITSPFEFPTALLREPCHLEVLIPAKNEAGRLPRTLERTIQYLERQAYTAAVVVIDNDSFDQTTDIASRHGSGQVPVHVTGCARPGKGAAVRHGMLGSRAAFVGYMDADLATPVETLDVVMPLLRRYPAVIASRHLPGARLAKRQPLTRSLGGAVFHTLAHRALPGLTDTQCGFKFFEGELARKVASRLTVDGFAFDVEMLRAVRDLGAEIKEVPVTWTDSKGSSLNPLRDGTQATMELLRMVQGRRAA